MCLRPLFEKRPGRWLEVGVGTGRFAWALGIGEGVDPSPPMLALAASRGLETYEGTAENLPFPKSSFDGVLMALTLCFVANSQKALRECRRVLHPGGCLLLGIVPADSPWGREYITKASQGHPVYARAHFHTAAEVMSLAQDAGFALSEAKSTLFWKPGETPPPEPQIEAGIVSGAGFLGLLFEETAAGPFNPDHLEARG
ncbi:MAG: class I SAM-dependent methyltransferase [Thermodesulfobacteriota bacterium]